MLVFGFVEAGIEGIRDGILCLGLDVRLYISVFWLVAGVRKGDGVLNGNLRYRRKI